MIHSIVPLKETIIPFIIHFHLIMNEDNLLSTQVNSPIIDYKIWLNHLIWNSNIKTLVSTNKVCWKNRILYSHWGVQITTFES